MKTKKEKSKKRTLNELRQTKEFNYKAPVSHRYAAKERKTICFTKKTLQLFLEDAIAHIVWERSVDELPGLPLDCKTYVKRYLNGEV